MKFFLILLILQIPIHCNLINRCKKEFYSFHEALTAHKIFAPEKNTTFYSNVGEFENEKRDWERGEKRKIEGGTNYNEYIEELLIVTRACSVVNCQRICQTGFNTGISALAFLCSSDQNTFVHSFDLGRHWYTKIAFSIIDEQYPGRHNVTIGSSVNTLPQLIKKLGPEHAKQYCNFAFVDGGHSYNVSLSDILNFALLSPSGTVIAVENCNSWGMKNGHGGLRHVNSAYQQAQQDGVILHHSQISIGPCGQLNIPAGLECREICLSTVI